MRSQAQTGTRILPRNTQERNGTPICLQPDNTQIIDKNTADAMSITVGR